MRTSIASSFLWSLVVIGAASAQDFDPELVKKLGIELAGQQRFGEAKSCFDRVLRDDPRDAEALRWRAHCNTGLGEFELVIPDLDLVVELEPTLPWPWYARGMAKRELGRLEESLPDYGEAIERDPRFFKAWEWRGFTQYQLGRPVEAIWDYDRAEPLDPLNPWLFQSRAYARMLVCDLERAKSDFERAVELDPESSEMREQVGFTSVALGQMDEAKVAFLKAVELRREGEEPWAELWLHRLFPTSDAEVKAEYGVLPTDELDDGVDPFIQLWARAIADRDLAPQAVSRLEEELGLADSPKPDRLRRRAEEAFYRAAHLLGPLPIEHHNPSYPSPPRTTAASQLALCITLGDPSMPEWHAARWLSRAPYE